MGVSFVLFSSSVFFSFGMNQHRSLLPFEVPIFVRLCLCVCVFEKKAQKLSTRECKISLANIGSKKIL